jgi:hypothetical protein
MIIQLTQENIERKEGIKVQDRSNLELSKLVKILSEMNEEGLLQYEELLEQQAESHVLQIAECDRMMESLRIQQITTTQVCQETCNVTQEMLGKVRAELVGAYTQIKDLRSELSSAWSTIHACYREMGDLRDELDDSGCILQ